MRFLWIYVHLKKLDDTFGNFFCLVLKPPSHFVCFDGGKNEKMKTETKERNQKTRSLSIIFAFKVDSIFRWSWIWIFWTNCFWVIWFTLNFTRRKLQPDYFIQFNELLLNTNMFSLRTKKLGKLLKTTVKWNIIHSNLVYCYL